MSNIKLKHLLTEQSFNAKAIAKKIYDAKGVFSDNETIAVNAIKSIKDSKQFNQVQTELQKLTGGRGIAQYVTSFIRVGAFGDTATISLLDKIIKHLISIQANPQSIKIFKKELGAIKSNQLDWSNVDMSGTGLGSPLTADAWKNPEYRHAVLTVAEIVSLCIPMIGPVLSRIIGVAHAGVYIKEGDYYSAGLYAAFALIPGGAKVAKSLTRKIVTKNGMLTKVEREVLIRAAMSKDAIKSKIAKITADGIKTGTINPNAIKSLKWIKPVAKGGYNVAWGGFKNFIAPTVIYNYGYDKTTGLYDKYVTIPNATKAVSGIDTSTPVPDWLQDYK